MSRGLVHLKWKSSGMGCYAGYFCSSSYSFVLTCVGDEFFPWLSWSPRCSAWPLCWSPDTEPMYHCIWWQLSSASPAHTEGGKEGAGAGVKVWQELLRAPHWFCAWSSLLWLANLQLPRGLGVLLALGFSAVWHDVRVGQERYRAKAVRAGPEQHWSCSHVHKRLQSELKYFIPSSLLLSQLNTDSCPSPFWGLLQTSLRLPGEAL